MKALTFAILLLVIGYFNLLNGFRGVFRDFFSPLSFKLSQQAFELKTFFGFLSQISTIRNYNQNLLNEIAILNSQITNLKHLREENEVLRSQINLKNNNTSLNFILANVMIDPSDNSQTTLIIDKGFFDNIEVGNNVILGNNILGYVSQVYSSSSQVLLVTNPNVTLTAFNIDSMTKTEGFITGEYSSFMNFSKVLVNEDLKVGDVIVTSGRDGIFRPNLVLGKVVEINNQATNSLKSAKVQSLVNFQTLNKVFVVLK